MLARIAGLDATNNKESVPGVVSMDGAVHKVWQEMDVMVHLVGLAVIDVYSNQVIYWIEFNYF